MKVGDLVRCVWQPGASIIKNDCADDEVDLIVMKHTIKGELGVIIDKDSGEHPRYTIIFPQLGGYTHPLMPSAFEMISESW
jgi:hypothetical protein